MSGPSPLALRVLLTSLSLSFSRSGTARYLSYGSGSNYVAARVTNTCAATHIGNSWLVISNRPHGYRDSCRDLSGKSLLGRDASTGNSLWITTQPRDRPAYVRAVECVAMLRNFTCGRRSIRVFVTDQPSLRQAPRPACETPSRKMRRILMRPIVLTKRIEDYHSCGLL